MVLGVDKSWEEGVDPHTVVDDVASEGGVVSAPHPFYLSTISASWLARDLKLAVESFNAMASILVYPNLVASRFARKYGLAVTGGSDAHSFEIVGLGRTVTEGDGPDDLVAEILHGRSRAEGDRPPLGFAAHFAYGSVVEVLRRALGR